MRLTKANNLSIIFFIQLSLWLVMMASAQENPNPQELGKGSVLEEGSWHRFPIFEEKVYRITANWLAQNGIANPAPEQLRLFSMGGQALPQKNSDNHFYDLREIPMRVYTNAQGEFEELLFFAEGPVQFNHNEEGNFFSGQKNIYSDTVWYYLQIHNASGKRLKEVPIEAVDGQSTAIYDQVIYYEEALQNMNRSGRDWYSRSFATDGSKTLEFSGPGLAGGGQIHLGITMMTQSFEPSSFDIYLNDYQLGNIAPGVIPDREFDVVGREGIGHYQLPASLFTQGSSSFRILMDHNRAVSGTSAAFFKNLSINYPTSLTARSQALVFRKIPSTTNPNINLRIRNFSDQHQLWDVSDLFEPKILKKEGQSFEELPFGIHEVASKRFAVFRRQDLEQPTSLRSVSNQNLKGLSTPDFLIISHRNFLPQAQRLAAHRSQHDGLSVKVVDVQQIYHEFSGGKKDPSALRNFVYYLDRIQGPKGKLKYLLLMGDCSFDYKDRLANNRDFVPTYQSRESLHQILTYNSDDYFGFLGDDEGEWQENEQGNYLLSMGIGRLPVKDSKEAQDVVDKIIRYQTDPQSLGAWRTRLAFIADDGDDTDGIIHQRDAERLATIVDTTFQTFRTRKIYVDQFDQIVTPQGERVPDGREDLVESIREGLFLVNFSGHGNKQEWTSERIFDSSLIPELRNRNRLPLFVTATCDFGAYDDPGVVSGGEQLVLQADGGAIALVSSTRKVFSHTNYRLNEALIRALFTKVDGHYLPIGEIFRRTKNNSISNVFNRNFSLLGDPSMRLNYPMREVVISHINGEDLNQDQAQAGALSEIYFEAEILNAAGDLERNFRGSAEIIVWDSPSMNRTLGNRTPVMEIPEYDNVLFKGRSSVRDGKLSANFIVPKTINYAMDHAKIAVYSKERHQHLDAAGASKDLILSGTDPNAPPDNDPPQISIFLNSREFEIGQSVGANPLVIVDFEDASGINTSERGLGQGIWLQLDDREPILITKYYEALEDDFQQGSLRYPLQELSDGPHRLKIRAWDTYNNPGEAEIEFQVNDQGKIAFRNFKLFPNPMRDHVQMSFEHDKEGHDLDLTFQVISSRGEIIFSKDKIYWSSEGLINDIEWNGRSAQGQQAVRGIYICRIYLSSRKDGSNNLYHEKVILID